MDFTLTTYRLLLKALKEQGYRFERYDEYISSHQTARSSPQSSVTNVQSSMDETSEVRDQTIDVRSEIAELQIYPV